MYSDTREATRIDERFAALDPAVSGVFELSFDVLATPERFALLQRLEQHPRRLPVPGHELLNGIYQQATAGRDRRCDVG